jgi:hypothetical protein
MSAMQTIICNILEAIDRQKPTDFQNMADKMTPAQQAAKCLLLLHRNIALEGKDNDRPEGFQLLVMEELTIILAGLAEFDFPFSLLATLNRFAFHE